jgi:Domain of Unknown Function (DUF1259)
VPDLTTTLSRRRALVAGGSVIGGLVAASSLVTGEWTAAAKGGTSTGRGSLPVDEIESILQTDGTVTNGVLSLELTRKDLHVTGPGGIPVKPSWALDHEFHFQPVGDGRAVLSVELTVLEAEVTPVLDRLLQCGLIEVMAVHNHLIETHPVVQYIHAKGFGDPLELARASIAAVRVTPTPLPQPSPTHPTTPLDTSALASILGGDARVMDEGVVEVDVRRRESISVEGVTFEPEMAVQVMLMFEPLGGGHQAAVMAELPCIAEEVTPVARVLRGQGLAVTALHHHEIAERPQLYFMHAVGVGTDVDLARRLARALDRMNLKRR